MNIAVFVIVALLLLGGGGLFVLNLLLWREAFEEVRRWRQP